MLRSTKQTLKQVLILSLLLTVTAGAITAWIAMYEVWVWFAYITGV